MFTAFPMEKSWKRHLHPHQIAPPRCGRRGAADVFGHRAEAPEDQRRAHSVAEIGEDRQEGVGIPASGGGFNDI